ncbi:MAG: DNA polymerase III subunit gamma/tau [Clostridiales Family XIII bacterium]|jgi:DNA polymerase-3 subunit gamma/tau|nr:DNA polymerase III subunit gamma/tau [Clostridiales Family XIII bacterium]
MDNHLTLYRKYRPKTFSEVLGQEHIVSVLKKQVNENTLSHAYLFSGIRGTGKTTMARLIAAGVNCTSDGEKPCGKCENCIAVQNGKLMDVMEIDAASHRGIEDARNLKNNIMYPPQLSTKKIIIIDEVHMLTKEAFNALLKTLEEPPEYVVFIFATTEIEKVPDTILSRCLKLNFKRVSANELAEGLKEISKKEKIDISASAINIIAGVADGSVRDSLSILEKLRGENAEINDDKIYELLGKSSNDEIKSLIGLIVEKNIEKVLLKINDILNQGKAEEILVLDIVSYLRDMLLVKFLKQPADVLSLSKQKINDIRNFSASIDKNLIIKYIEKFSSLVKDIKNADEKRIILEMRLIDFENGS